MNKLLTIIFSALIVLSLLLGAGAFFGLFQPKGEPGLTIVTAPDQTKAQRPPCFPDPEANYIPMPETENFAEGKPVSSGEHTDVYMIENVNDGKTDTYWESKGFPAEVTVDLGESRRLTAVADGECLLRAETAENSLSLFVPPERTDEALRLLHREVIALSS